MTPTWCRSANIISQMWELAKIITYHVACAAISLVRSRIRLLLRETPASGNRLDSTALPRTVTYNTALQTRTITIEETAGIPVRKVPTNGVSMFPPRTHGTGFRSVPQSIGDWWTQHPLPSPSSLKISNGTGMMAAPIPHSSDTACMIFSRQIMRFLDTLYRIIKT